MTHNDFRLKQDIIKPVMNFLNAIYNGSDLPQNSQRSNATEKEDEGVMTIK
jgi:hypothetical protein